VKTLTVKRTVYFISTGPSVQSPKSGKQRTIPLNAAAEKALREIAELRQPGGKVVVRASAPLEQRLVLTSQSRAYLRPSVFRRALDQACRAAGLREVTPHILRHSFASHLAMAGVDMLTIARLMGHQSVTTTMRYSHLAKEGVRAATDRLDALSARQVPAPAEAASETGQKTSLRESEGEVLSPRGKVLDL